MYTLADDKQTERCLVSGKPRRHLWSAVLGQIGGQIKALETDFEALKTKSKALEIRFEGLILRPQIEALKSSPRS